MLERSRGCSALRSPRCNAGCVIASFLRSGSPIRFVLIRTCWLRLFRRHQVDTVALSINLDEFHQVIPEAKTEARPDFETFLYGMTTKFLIERIADRHCVRNPNARIALIHDRSAYDGVMLEAFNQQVADPNFAYKGCFTTLTSTGWESCIPLQPADLVAYENFKDAMRKVNPRDRRTSLEMLIDLDAFSGRAQSMGTDAILKLRQGLLAAACGSIPA